MSSENNEERKRPESEEAKSAPEEEVADGEATEDPLHEEGSSDAEPADAGEPSYEVVEVDPPDEAEVGEVADIEEVEALRAELDAVTRERDEYLDSLLRLKAEFDNSRKRQEKERERILQTASERLILSLLPVLDNLDRALESEGDIRGGVRATRDQLSEAMEQEGLLLVESDGQHFDPNLHEAVMSQPSEEHEEGTVLQTFERGYVLNGKSIRPARVIVSHQG